MLAAATILGSGGFVPTGRRETSSVLLLPQTGDGAVVIDAGTGIRRLVTDRGLLGGRRHLDVLLTHFHIDHICGLPYLTELADLEIIVHGPGRALYDTATEDVLARIFTPPVMPIGMAELGMGIAECGPGTIVLDGLEVRARRQDHHTNPTLGLRVGDALAWCTDTDEDPGTPDFARGARVLAHDAWPAPAAPGHATPAGAARMAAAAESPALVLIHVPPAVDEDAMRAEAAALHPGAVLATDGMDLLTAG